MGRIIAIDYGKRRIGIAMTDKEKIIASPFTTIEALKTFSETIDKILKTLDPYLPEIDKSMTI